MPRPKRAGSKKKLRDTIEAQRQERLGQLRATPETRLDEGEVTGIYLTAVENIRSQASRRPAMGRIAVFIVAEADRMVPQTASPEAANAFLKLLEEPPDFAYLILTTSRPQALLPTIRSRTAGLRVAPLTDADVERFLIEDRGLAQGDARTVARRAEGSIGRALGLTSQTDDASALTADRLLAAALRADPGSRYTTAGQFTAQGARSILAPALEELEERLRDVLCYASGATDLARDPGKSARILERWPVEESAVLAALAAVERAREDAHRNLNPQATVSVLLADMSVALGTR
jgi:DNA polymerase-3 subunit delta'